MVKIVCRIGSNPANYPAYDRKYELYKKVYRALDGLWNEFSLNISV